MTILRWSTKIIAGGSENDAGRLEIMPARLEKVTRKSDFALLGVMAACEKISVKKCLLDSIDRIQHPPPLLCDATRRCFGLRTHPNRQTVRQRSPPLEISMPLSTNLPNLLV